MAKVIWSGLEDAGKSLELAMRASDIVQRNGEFYKITGVVRPLYSNLKFSEDFRVYAEEKMVPIRYWKNLDELIELSDCDVIIDEIGKYFDSRLWKDLSLDVRAWLGQASKIGVDIYGTAQDFAQVDLTFRRLVNELYEVTKIIGSPRPTPTRPPVKYIWGVCMVREIDPKGYEENKKKVKSFLPKIFFIKKKYCEIFDTRQKIDKSTPPPLVHEERYCPDPHCAYHRNPKIAHI